jgi:hypothetical protein
MGRSFQPARGAKTVPQVQSIAYTTGQTFKKGAVLIDVAAGTVSECGADPDAVRGVALEAAGSKPGYDVANSSVATVFTGRLQEVSMALADRTTEFSGRAVNGGTDPVVPLQTHIGEEYGIAKVGDDWVIDMAETTAKVVHITDIRPEDNAFLFKFLEAVLAQP